MILLSSDVADITLEDVVKEPSLWKEYWNNMLPTAMTIALKVIIAIIVLLIGRWLIRRVVNGVKKALDKSKMEPGVKGFLCSLMKYVLYFLLIMLILNQFGITASMVVALLGSAGLTIGLGLQGSLSNFAGGVLILILKPFVIGDYIMEKATGLEGTVTDITLFYTKLTTVDNKQVNVPNGTLSNTSVVNYTKFNKRRVDVNVSVAYDSDLKKVKEVLHEAALDIPSRIEGDPIDVFVASLDDSCVKMEVRIWSSVPHYWDAKWKLTEDVKTALDDAGIVIPFPQLDVHTK